MLFICLIYILDYIINEKYEIEISVFVSFRDQLTTDERNLNKIPEININFLIQIFHFGFSPSSDPFYVKNLVLKNKKGEYIKQDGRNWGFQVGSFNITKKLSELKKERYEIIYKCPKHNCSASFVSLHDVLSINK